MVKTRNANLQTKLEQWSLAVSKAVALPSQSPERASAISQFCRTFVPPDVEDEDISHFTNSLVTDDEFFESMFRELSQCASGEKVEKIEGDQLNRAMFTITPMEGLVTGNLDIVRELGFISNDRGLTWTAEVSALLSSISPFTYIVSITGLIRLGNRSTVAIWKGRGDVQCRANSYQDRDRDRLRETEHECRVLGVFVYKLGILLLFDIKNIRDKH